MFVKRKTLIKKINEAAKTRSVGWDLVRQGANHEIWQCGNTKTVIPRHNEINEMTAEGICKGLAPELGEDWWK